MSDNHAAASVAAVSINFPAVLAEQQWLLSFDHDMRANVVAVPADMVTVSPHCDADMIDLIGNKVPADMLPELMRIAAWRSLGLELPPAPDFEI